MRTLFLIGQGLLLAFVVFVMPACHGDSKTIEIRALLSHTVVPSVSSDIQTAIEIAIKDFGPINGHQVSIETLDEMCSGEGGRAAAEAVVADARVVGVIGTLCSGAAVEASPIISKAGLSMVSPANTSPVLTSDLSRKCQPALLQGLLPCCGQRPHRGGHYRAFQLRGTGVAHNGDDS